jgi:hypothetical protein
MKKKEIILFGGVVLLLAIIITVSNALKPKPIDWRPTYAARDKIPFGLYVLDKEAPALFKNDSIQKVHTSPYEFLENKFNYDDKRYDIKGTYLKISEENTIDPESVKELLYFAEYGNTVMLSMKSFPFELLDTLKITMGYQRLLTDSVQVSMKDSSQKYWFKNGMGSAYFDSIPQNDSVTLLGYQQAGGIVKPNFIEARFGQGRFLLHTQPAAFSNYYLLKGSHANYAQAALSAIPKGSLYWQNDFGASDFENADNKLRYIFSQPGLKWAWRLGLWGLLLFIIFNARRKQRIVPQIAPVRNTTVDFAKTIGNLYYQEGDHHTIIDKKIIYFLEQVRTEYLIDTYSLDDAFAQKLHLKTGKPLDDIQCALQLIKKHRQNLTSTNADVVAINKAIEKLRL